MSAALQTFESVILLDTHSTTSSPASADGPTLSDSLAGPMIGPYGPDPALASLSARQAADLVRQTRDTCGLYGASSSASIALQQCLVSRLRVRLLSHGSPLFKMTWKAQVTPSRRLIYRLRASAHRISGSASASSQIELQSAWPTATARDWKSSASNKHGDNARPLNEVARLATRPTPTAALADKGVRTLEVGIKEAMRNHGPDLAAVSCLCLSSWATPAAQEAGGTPEQFLARKELLNGACGVSLTSLALQAQTASWPTPTVLGSSNTRNATANRSVGAKKAHAGTTLVDAADFASWPTPMAGSPAMNGNNEAGNTDSSRKTVALVFGQPAIGYPVATVKPGQLNPAHSRWLMGYPVVWDSCGATAMQSLRRSSRSSLPLIST